MLRESINTAVKEAMKAKDERKLSTLRMVNAAIKNADIDARGQSKPPLSDSDVLSLLQKMIKQRQESVELMLSRIPGERPISSPLRRGFRRWQVSLYSARICTGSS